MCLNVSVVKLYLYVSEWVRSKIIKELPGLVGSGTSYITTLCYPILYKFPCSIPFYLILTYQFYTLAIVSCHSSVSLTVPSHPTLPYPFLSSPPSTLLTYALSWLFWSQKIDTRWVRNVLMFVMWRAVVWVWRQILCCAFIHSVKSVQRMDWLLAANSFQFQPHSVLQPCYVILCLLDRASLW